MLNSAQKLVCFRNLCKIVTTDNYLTFSEQEVLLCVAQKMGLQDLRAWHILKNTDEVSLVIPENKDIRQQFLEYTISTMIIEGDLPDREYEWCLAVARQIGQNEVVLQKMINRLSKKMHPRYPKTTNV